MRWGEALFALVLATTVGCKETADASGGGTDTGGSQGGDSSTVTDTEPGINCIDTEQIVDIDWQTPLGFSARDVVEGVAGPYATQLEWLENTHEVELEPAGEVVDLAIHVWYDGGEVVYVDRQPDPIGVATPEDCVARMFIDVTVGLTTADGRFAEHIDTQLYFDPNYPVCWEIRDFDLNTMNGTFSRDDMVVEPPGEVAGMEIMGCFEESGPYGAITLHIHEDHEGGESNSSIQVACWPPGLLG